MRRENKRRTKLFDLTTALKSGPCYGTAVTVKTNNNINSGPRSISEIIITIFFFYGRQRRWSVDIGSGVYIETNPVLIFNDIPSATEETFIKLDENFKNNNKSNLGVVIFYCEQTGN